MKTATKYQVTRIATSLKTYKERRTYHYFDELDEAIDWAKRHSTKDNITCKVFAFDGYFDDDLNDYVWMSGGRDTERDYDAIFEKCGDRIIVDATKDVKASIKEEEESAKFDDAAVTEKHKAFKMYVPREMNPEDFDDPQFIEECGGIVRLKNHLTEGICNHVMLITNHRVGVAFCMRDPEFVDINDFGGENLFADRIHTSKLKPSEFVKVVWEHVEKYLRKIHPKRRNVAC